MSEFSVVLRNRTGTIELYPPQGFVLVPKRYSAGAIGGPDRAEIVVDGVGDALWSVLNWVGYLVEIRNHLGTPVWWGRVEEADVQVSSVRRGVTLAKMYNKILVIFTAIDVDGLPISSATGWVSESESINRYGTRELRYSLGDGDGTSATARRDYLLSRVAKPKAKRRRSESTRDGATLYCVGLWRALDDAYYSQPAGKEENAVSGNGTQVIGWSLAANTIAFDASASSISDSGNRLAGLQRYDKLVVTGSTANNGTFTVDSVNTDGAQVRVVETIVNEVAGSSVTVTAWGTWVAQSFTPVTAWNAVTVLVRLAKVGSPADNITIELQSNSGGTPSGTILAFATITPGTIGTTMAWKLASLSASVGLTGGTMYWVVIKRSGAASAVNYYSTSVDSALAYAGGSLLLRTPTSTWVARVINADLPFRVLDTVDSAAQIRAMLATVSLFSAVDGSVSSGISSNQWRDGKNRTLAELVKLLDLKTTDGRRLIAGVTVDRVVHLLLEPTASEYGLSVRGDEFYTVAGVPLSAGVLPVGAWAREVELPQNLDDLVDGSMLFVEWAEYDCARGEMVWRPRDDDDLLALPSVEQG